jgi:protein deglycase
MSYSETILVPLAEGFEEIEAVTIIDVLRRAGLSVMVAGLGPSPVTGAHGVAFGTDCSLDEVIGTAVGMIVLPGGMPGTENLAEDERILSLVRDLHGRGKRVAAICAAPLVLARAGILGEGPVTSHPTVRDRLGGARYLEEPRVVRSGPILTSQGPGSALEFALEIVQDLCGGSVAKDLASAMLVRS